MPVDQNRQIYEVLTRWNYFANQKAPVGELPPSISTRQFTPEIAELVVAGRDSELRGKVRYDDVSHFRKRHDNVPCKLVLTHSFEKFQR